LGLPAAAAPADIPTPLTGPVPVAPEPPTGPQRDEIRRALAGYLGHLAASPARLVLVDLEDLWLERRPQNRPGTAGGANWRRRAGRTLSQLAGDPFAQDVLAEVDRLRRCPPTGPVAPPPSESRRTA
jgi:hypothetical protein